MDSFYLLDLIKERFAPDQGLFNTLKYELDKRIYYYGDQFKYPFSPGRKKLPQLAKGVLKRVFITSKIISSSNKSATKPRILSSAYFTVNSELSSIGYDVFCPPWSITKDRNVLPDLELYEQSRKMEAILQKASFAYLLSEDCKACIESFELQLELSLKKCKINAVMVANDIGFFESILIKVCKKRNIPSFIFLHGLPGRYNIIDENKTDFLIVWGKKIKQNYIDYGFNEKKVIISGHPYYKDFKLQPLSFSLENVLVLTKSMSGGQHSDKVRVGDRGNSILYLLSIEKVLRSFGVKSVKLRPHPSESIEWYYQYIDAHFFKADTLPLESSIANSSLLLGPTSTVFLEAIYNGKNYLVYEPANDEVDLFGFKLIPPFNKKDARVPVATNDVELSEMIKEKRVVVADVFYDYIQTKFDIAKIKDIVKA